MIRVRPALATVAAAALLPSLLAASASAASSAVPASAPVVVHGRVLLKGKPVAGATVKLYADPLPSALRKVKEAKRVPDALIGTAKSSRKGFYSVRLTAKAMAVVRARAVRGIVNLHVLAFTHKAGTVLWFPRTVSLRKLAAGAAVPSLATPEVADLKLPAGESTAMSPMVRSLLGPAHPGFDWGECGLRVPHVPAGREMGERREHLQQHVQSGHAFYLRCRLGDHARRRIQSEFPRQPGPGPWLARPHVHPEQHDELE